LILILLNSEIRIFIEESRASTRGVIQNCSADNIGE